MKICIYLEQSRIAICIFLEDHLQIILNEKDTTNKKLKFCIYIHLVQIVKDTHLVVITFIMKICIFLEQ